MKDSDSSVLVRFAYTRDAAGNPIAIERESGLGTFYYEYDSLQRLAYEGQFVSAARQYENYYEYDPAGNRTLLRHGETGAENLTYYDYNAANELTQLHDADGWTYFEYDANGNTVMEQTPAHRRYFDWDGRDMLVGVRSTEGGWTDNEYRYDGLAARVSTVESAGFSYYDWDGINVIQEKTDAGTVTDRQIHGYAPIVSVGDIAHMDKSGTAYVPTADQVGTIWDLLDTSATKANSYSFDAFGVGRTASEAVCNKYRFGTKRRDPDSGLYHFIARQYEPGRARFATRDLLAFAYSGSSYAAFLGNPIGNVDPLGLDITDIYARFCFAGSPSPSGQTETRTEIDWACLGKKYGRSLIECTPPCAGCAAICGSVCGAAFGGAGIGGAKVCLYCLGAYAECAECALCVGPAWWKIFTECSQEELWREMCCQMECDLVESRRTTGVPPGQACDKVCVYQCPVDMAYDYVPASRECLPLLYPVVCWWEKAEH